MLLLVLIVLIVLIAEKCWLGCAIECLPSHASGDGDGDGDGRWMMDDVDDIELPMLGA